MIYSWQITQRNRGRQYGSFRAPPSLMNGLPGVYYLMAYKVIIKGLTALELSMTINITMILITFNNFRRIKYWVIIMKNKPK